MKIYTLEDFERSIAKRNKKKGSELRQKEKDKEKEEKRSGSRK